MRERERERGFGIGTDKPNTAVHSPAGSLWSTFFFLSFWFDSILCVCVCVRVACFIIEISSNSVTSLIRLTLRGLFFKIKQLRRTGLVSVWRWQPVALVQRYKKKENWKRNETIERHLHFLLFTTKPDYIPTYRCNKIAKSLHRFLFLREFFSVLLAGRRNKIHYVCSFLIAFYFLTRKKTVNGPGANGNYVSCSLGFSVLSRAVWGNCVFFYRVWPSLTDFTTFYWVLLGFTCFFSSCNGFYWVFMFLSRFTAFY